MSDDHLDEETLTEDDRRLLDLVDGMAADPGEAARSWAGEAAGREWLETLGLLPYELDELAPRPSIKVSLMARIDGAVGAPPARAGEPPLPTSGQLAALERRARWYMPIAAAFAIALLGVAAFQFGELERQRRTIADLSSQLERVAQSGTELASLRSLLDEQRSHLRMLTARGTEYCLLRPVGEPPRFPGATATMVISPERNRWYLAAEGLEPCAAKVCYELWFVTDGGSIRAAAFDAETSASRVELSGTHDRLPSTVRAITITRVPGPETEEPAETVLLADQAMTLL